MHTFLKIKSAQFQNEQTPNLLSHMRTAHIFISLFTVLGFLLTGCASTKNTTYFQNVGDSIYRSPEAIALSHYSDPLIHPNDILQISVQTIDPQSTTSMGTQSSSSFAVGGGAVGMASAQAIQGYMVDKEGYIELPLVGKIKVGGMTTDAARDAIKKKATIYYKDPVVNVRWANFYISVLGEVNRPSQYIIPNEKINLLEAIAMAGDLTIFGKRDNVMLIREENGEKKAIRFDLRSTDIFQNPYFYLRQGDVIYVQANKTKVAASDARMIRTVAIITSVSSLLVAVIYRLGK